MKKIIISLGIIGVVAAVTLGITGAWWSDSATSHNASFTSGNVDLKLSNSYDTSKLVDTVTETWDQSNMAPGGTPLEAILWMKNVGSINADHMDFAVANTMSGCNGGWTKCQGLDDQMRITKLEYADKNLLTGGAGADVASTCNINVGSDQTYHTIQAGISAATSGNTVCVAAGAYVENVVIPLGKDNLQLIGAGSDVTSIKPTSGKAVALSGNLGVITGFTIKGFTLVTPNAYAFIALSGTNDGTTYTTNLILEDIVVDGPYGIGLNAVNGVTLTNVHLSNTVSGGGALELTGVSNLLFTQGSIKGNTIGVHLQPTGIGEVGAGYGPNGNIQIHSSNLVGNITAIKNEDEDSETSINATNNWWSPSGQVLIGNVGYTPYAGGPFIGYIIDSNGNGFADLADFQAQGIKNVKPGLAANAWNKLDMAVQLDGPTTGNEYQGGKVAMDMTVTMQQGPVQ